MPLWRSFISVTIGKRRDCRDAPEIDRRVPVVHKFRVAADNPLIELYRDAFDDKRDDSKRFENNVYNKTKRYRCINSVCLIAENWSEKNLLEHYVFCFGSRRFVLFCFFVFFLTLFPAFIVCILISRATLRFDILCIYNMNLKNNTVYCTSVISHYSLSKRNRYFFCTDIT